MTVEHAYDAPPIPIAPPRRWGPFSRDLHASVTRVVILDVDGPVIPATQVLMDPMSSWNRIVPRHTVAVLDRLCRDTGAKVVFNTTHNDPWPWAPAIEDALVEAGLDPVHLHPTDLRTAYPDVDRTTAVADWLGRHPEVTEWVAFDDEAFTDDDRLVWIDPNAGLHVGHLNEALALLGAKPVRILM